MYDGLSEFYDLFMQDVDYNAWCDFISHHIPTKGCGLDVGCGSGKLTLMLSQRGFNMSGVDLSPEMVAIAMKNARRNAITNVSFAVGNAEKINLSIPVDFITATCDVVNYLKNPIDFFKNTYNNLKAGGVFVFDISSEYKLKKVLGNNVSTEEKDGVVYVWNNNLYRNRVDMFLSFFRRDEDGRYTRFDEEQTQYVHNENDIIVALKSVGFSSVEIFADFGENLSKNSERIHFIAKKGK